MAATDHDQGKSRMPGFKTDEEFWSAFRRLDALNGKGSRWDKPRAAKPHIDIFGQPVEEGEQYFSRVYGGLTDRRIVSRRSMEAMLAAVMIPDGYMEQMADLLIKEETQKLRDISSRIHGGSSAPLPAKERTT